MHVLASQSLAGMTLSGTKKLSPVSVRTAWPLLPLAPAVVIVVGLAVAIAIGIVGVDHLARASD